MGTQLVEIGTSTSEKTLNYANEMDSAVDCAFRGIPIEECSPTLTDTNFEPEIKEYIDFNKEMQDQIDALYEAQKELEEEIANNEE